MINYLLRGIASAVALKALANYRHLSTRLLKVEAAKSYVHGVRLARLATLGLMGMSLMVGLVFLGLLLVHMGLFVLLPGTLKAKAAFGIVLGMSYLLAGFLVLRAKTDEKLWVKKSGAATMLEDVTRAS